MNDTSSVSSCPELNTVSNSSPPLINTNNYHIGSIEARYPNKNTRENRSSYVADNEEYGKEKYQFNNIEHLFLVD